MEPKKQRLLALLLEKSFRYRTDPPFTLASGKTSPYYVDCKPTTNNAEGMALIGEVVFERIKSHDIQAVGGLTMGADPIAHATALTGFRLGKPVNSFSVRKAAKDHGFVKEHGVEGDVCPGDRVAILEDVITTGNSTILAIQAARAFGLEIVKVVALLDREGEGRQNIRRFVSEVESIFTLSELLRAKGIEVSASNAIRNP